MRELVHPNLVNLKDIFLEKSRLLLVMELMQVETRNSHQSLDNILNSEFSLNKKTDLNCSGRSLDWCGSLHSDVRGADSCSDQGDPAGVGGYFRTYLIFYPDILYFAQMFWSRTVWWCWKICSSYIIGHRLPPRARSCPQRHQIWQCLVRRGSFINVCEIDIKWVEVLALLTRTGGWRWQTLGLRLMWKEMMENEWGKPLQVGNGIGIESLKH